MKRSWLGDALGIVAALSAVAVLPGLDDPLTYIKLTVLSVGGMALLPWGLTRWWQRWKKSPGRSRLMVIPVTAALGLAVWSVISMIATGTPWAVALFGWFGRGDGVLALIGAAGLMVTASALSRSEVQRAIDWILAGAALATILGLLQITGVSFPRGAPTDVVTGAAGNQNFAGAYLAIMLPLAAGLAAMRGRTTMLRVASALLAAVMAVEIVFARSLQGPVAAIGGLFAAFVVWSWMYRGSRAVLMRSISSGGVVVAVALLVLSAAGIGPLTRLWSESTFVIRQQYWQSAVNMMSGMPVFGTGPGSFARFIGEYRPDSYVATLGPNLNVSAAHNVALHFGATLGLVGLVLWVLTFGGVVVTFLVMMRRVPSAWAVASAAAFGALVAYLIQGLVSIDMLPLLATGWTVAGLALAAVVSPTAPDVPSPATSGKGRRTPISVQAKAPTATIAASIVLGLLALVLTAWNMAAFASVSQATSVDRALEVIKSPLTPCTIRLSLLESAVPQLPVDVVISALDEAVAVDPRCPAMKTLEAQVALQTGDLERARTATAEAVSLDPKFYFSWVLRAEYFIQSGELEAALQAYDEAVTVQALYSDRSIGQADLVTLRDRLLEAGVSVTP